MPTVGLSFGEVLYVATSDHDYDPAFVERVLQAAAAPVVAKFDNVIDMLDWLERD